MAVCSACGQVNSLTARYCQACGAPLELDSRRSEERKVVTVLFCDLVGFTSRSERADPEEVRTMLRAYYQAVRTVIERYGGTVEKFIGDAVVAIFGAPLAHDDDPERALRAAFRVLEAIGGLSAEWSQPDLAVRIGINTGETIVTPSAAELGEGIATGDVVNTAARLQTFAPAGGVVVGEVTHHATLHLVDYEALPPADLKGKATLTPVWRALSLRSRLGAEMEDIHSGPLVGREDELRTMMDAFLRMLDQRSVRLLTLVGEAGLGKSRLVGELFRFVDERTELIHWRHARCLPYGDSFTFWPLAQIVKAHAGILESDGPEVWPDKLDAAIGTLPLSRADRDWVRARLGPLLGQGAQEGGEPTQQAESFMAWRRFLEAVASVHPLVLVVEDIHWADDPMLDFLEHLVMGREDYPMLVLCTARPQLFDRRPQWGSRWVDGSVISLAPLSDVATTKLLGPTLDQRTTSLLIERAGGNPLFAREFARLVRDTASERHARGEVEGGLSSLVEVPGSITSIIAARLDALPPRVKSVLQDASVVGKVFWSGALAAISHLDEADVLKALRELSKRELVSRLRTSRMQSNEELAFSHVLVRDVAYGQIPRAARATKHRAVAEWLERVSGDPRDVPELLAYHYEQALELSATSGVPLDGLEDRLRAALLAAGDRAMSLDVGRAAGYYQRALGVMSPVDPDRPRALTGFADAGAQAGRFSEAERAYDEAIEAFRATGDGVRTGDVMRKLSNLLWHRGEVARSRAVLDGAIEVLEGAVSGRELMEACSEVGWVRMLDGDLHSAASWAGRALDISAELGLLELRPKALALRGQARCHIGDLTGIDDIREGLNLAIELGLTREAARAHEILAEELIATGGPEEAAKVTRVGIELAEGRGVTYMATALRALTLLPSLVLQGQWTAALAEADIVVSWSSGAGGSYFATLARAHAAHVRVWQGEILEPDHEDGFLPAAREIGDPQVLVPALAVAAMVRWAGRRAEAAHEAVAELASFEGDPAGWITAPYLPDLGRVCRDARPDLAESLLERVSGPARLSQLGRLTVQAILEEGAGRLDSAAARYAEAAEGWAVFGSPPLQASCLLDEAQCLLRLGDGEAKSTLAEARDRAERLGARGL
jgi:class 3 adenylate cyclase/tetratricopeptide (TPR) repeat protein